MKTKLLLSLILSFYFCLLSSQVPQGFNYQAIARDGSGNPIANATIKVMLSILSDTTGFYVSGSGTYIWEEEQTNVKTNVFGLFTIVLGNPLASKVQGTASSFSAIDWVKTPLYIGTKIANPTNYKIMGSAKLWSVPYSMVADSSKALFKGSKLSVVSSNDLATDALFEVKRKDGQTVFAVYPDSVNIYVPNIAKGATKGGFAIGGFDVVKGNFQNFFRVTPDSVRIYIDSNSEKGARKGGFAIGGFNQVKGSSQKFLTVNKDSTRILTGDPIAGFAVQDLSTNGKSYLHVQSGISNGLGVSNIFLGPESGSKNTQGSFNVFLGHTSGYNNETGHDNVFVGQRAGYTNLSGNANLFAGQNSGENNYIGTHNVFVGYESGKYNISGTRNVYLGTQAGFSDSVGNYNVFLGNEAGFYEKGSNKLYIDNLGSRSSAALVYGDFNSKELRMNAKVGINSDNSGYSLNVAGDINFNGQLYQNQIPFNPGLVKVQLTENLTSPLPYTNPSVGLLVYNSGTIQPQGFYFWDGAQWHHIFAPTAPAVSVKSVTGILGGSATINGNVASDGGTSITGMGFCWNTSGHPGLTDFHVLYGTPGTGDFSSTISGLTNYTDYHVRSYAQNGAGISFSQEVIFNSGNTVTMPVLTTVSVTNITGTSALSGGNVQSDGGSPVLARGVCWNTGGTPTIANYTTNDGSGTGTFTSNLTSLTMGSTYYIRAYATNALGTAYGDQYQFTTPTLPVVTTTLISSITQTGATGGGNITSAGGGVITQKGICWSQTNTTPGISDSHTNDGTGSGVFSSTLSGLSAYTLYYVRAYATNSAGTGFGNVLTFTTLPPPVTDIDGNIYNTVSIGTQVWMASNLVTTKYNDGTSIPFVTDNGSWSGLITPAYCWYNNDATTYKATYGALYNWYTVNTGKLCPTGWHVPTDAEWTTLSTYLGGESIAGGALKETGTNHWISPNTGATNTFGFTGLPGEMRNGSGVFDPIGYYGYWWTATQYSAGYALYWYLGYNFTNIFGANGYMRIGFSVRCVKDN
jgi:uncharacterized protein (TIGR02145 family)